MRISSERQLAGALIDALQNGCGHREDAGISRGDHAHLVTGLRERERMTRTIGLDLVIRAKTSLPGSHRNAIEIGVIANQIGRIPPVPAAPRA